MAPRSNAIRETQALADHIGEFTMHWGFKRVHGRIWTHLIISAKPLDASELMRRLSISKALASMSLSELLAMDVIRNAGKSVRGTQLYSANPNLFEVIQKIIRNREREMFAKMHKAAVCLGRLPVTRHRQHELHTENIKHLATVFEGITSAFENFVKNLRFDLSGLRAVQLAAHKAITRPR